MSPSRKPPRFSRFAPQPRGLEIYVSSVGRKIYSLGIKHADKLYLTLVDREYPDADAFFPDYSEFKKVVSEENRVQGDLKYKFIELIKKF